jgi:hypothetical protein
VYRDMIQRSSTRCRKYATCDPPAERCPQRLILTFNRDRVTDITASVLRAPSGYWSIFSVLSADGSGPAAHRAVSWMRRNIVPAIAGSLADTHNATLPPPDADIDEALRQALGPPRQRHRRANG